MDDLLELLDVRMRTMWCHDERGRITTQNRPGAQPAPRLVVSRSGAGVVWRTSPAVTPEQVADLRRVVVDEGDWRTDRPDNLDAILDVLAGVETALGATPLYCTDWSNTASQRLARAAGFEHYSTDLYVL